MTTNCKHEFTDEHTYMVINESFGPVCRVYEKFCLTCLHPVAKSAEAVGESEREEWQREKRLRIQRAVEERKDGGEGTR